MGFGSVNNVFIQGICWSDLAIRTYPSGSVMVEFDLSVEENNRISFFRVLFFGDNAEHLRSANFAKGKMVCLIGYLDTYYFEEEGGGRKQSNKIVGTQIVSFPEQAKGISQVCIVGTVADAPVFRPGKTADRNITTFALISNRPTSFKPFPGQPDTPLLNVTCAKKLSDIAYRNLHKGRLIAIIGSLVSSTLPSDQPGFYRATTWGRSIQFLSPKTQEA